MLKSMHGLSLVELMVATTLGSLVLTAFLSLFVSMTSNLYQAEQQLRLQSELKLIAEVIEQDVRNAGYDALATQRRQDDSLSASPFENQMMIEHFSKEQAQSCITYVKDTNQDGLLTLNNPNERRGYRLRKHAIEYRMSGKSCSQTGWQKLTSTDLLRVTQFEIKEEVESNDNKSKLLSIAMSAELTENRQIKQALFFTVRIQNAWA